MQYLSQYRPLSPSCPRADAGALSTEPQHCVSIGPAMAGLGNARQDTLDAGEAGEGGVWSSGCHCWAGGVTIPGRIMRGALGRERGTAVMA